MSRPRALRWPVALAAACAAHASGVEAQEVGTVVGLVGGLSRTEQIWKPSAAADEHVGVVAGAFAEVPTTLGGISVRAEGAVTRRGGDVTLEAGGEPASGRIRSTYLTVSVHGVLSRWLGPVRASVAVGPTFDQLLSSRLDPILGQALDEEKAVVLGLAAGAGLGGWVADRVRVQVDVRIVEGLSDAYDGNFVSARNRSLEGLARVAVPLAVLRSRSR